VTPPKINNEKPREDVHNPSEYLRGRFDRLDVAVAKRRIISLLVDLKHVHVEHGTSMSMR
jgi:hypothetical protein